MAYLLEKDKSTSDEIVRLFEKVRVAYLSARTDPKEYGSKWRKSIDSIKEAYENTNELANELKNFIEISDLETDDVKDPQSQNAEKIFNGIKKLRYSSESVADPFAKRFKGEVLEELLSSTGNMVKFVHYAIRDDNKALSPDIYAVKDITPDDITDGLQGLDLEVDDIDLYIIEHYGDGKDSNKVESKVKAAMGILELIFLSKNSEDDWEVLEEIEGLPVAKAEKKSKEEKSESDFIVPNKPMYRIFEIEDMNELKGFTGEYYVQEKYDGLRIQMQKIDKKIKVYSFDGKDITSKCKEQVDELKKKHFGDCILDGSLMLFKGEEHQKRAETIAHVFDNKNEDGILKMHIFDLLRHNEKSLLEEPLEQRMTLIFNNYSIHSSEMLAFPSKKDTRLADSIKDVEEYSKAIMEMPTAEGVVIKDATSTYYVGTKKNPKWIKWKNFVDLDLIVLDKKSSKGNYSYTLGAGPTEGEGKDYQTIEGKTYMVVGKALNTKISADLGSIVRVKIDQVKKEGERYIVHSAKVIEVPEAVHPDKLVTLELLAKDEKKSLNYNVEALKKGIVVTDHIHGEASILIKSDMDGFTIYGFEEDNLMAKNALVDLDLWKTQAEEIMKTKQSRLTVAGFQHMKTTGPKTIKELHNHLVKNHKDLYEDILESKFDKLKDWMKQRDGISYDEKTKKLYAEDDKIMQEGDILKEYKTPKEYQQGKFKLYLRDDDNLNLVIKLKDESINWLIDLEDDSDIFELFGKAGKFPAMVANNISKRKIIDEGEVRLGVQKHGYHEYFLEGNKFETKFNIRKIKVDNKDMWLAWSGYKQSPADEKDDAGLWNIYEDRNKELPLPEK
jgi:ATP-dependent DNA ligase/cation transport regulator ChaB